MPVPAAGKVELEAREMTRASWQSGLSLPILILSMALVGCASLPSDYPRTVSTAYTDTDDTTLGRNFAPIVNTHPGESGFHMLYLGLEALAARLLLIDEAERSIDVQYYFIRHDTTGTLFVNRLLQAADRGVRVRVLIDDLQTSSYEGKDKTLVALDSHPYIEIRVFNPFAHRKLRVVDALMNFTRINRRMHNKSLIIDNQVAIVGGRNIGDEYFEACPELDFGDLDVLGIGPVVQDVSDAFDAYWNSEMAYPISVLASARRQTISLEDVQRHLAARAEVACTSHYAVALRDTSFARSWDSGHLSLYWGPAQVVYDLPDKIKHSSYDMSTHMGPQLWPIIETAKTEVLIVSPYFVPRDWGVGWFQLLRSKSVRITILTNSLASTDVLAVHAGYAPYRRELLKAGVELYELKPDVSVQPGANGTPADVQSSLHAKAFSVDRRLLFVGSFNMDPRSALHNTEMGILIESPELAKLFVDTLFKDFPTKTYRLVLTSSPAASPRLEWVTLENDREVRYQSEPQTGFWRRFSVNVLSWLPIENLL